MQIPEKLTEIFGSSPGKMIGAIVGFLLGVLVLTFGVLKILVVVIFILLGIIVGKMIDDRSSVVESIMNIFRRR